jgi:flagellar biosynthesis/type III secretory pathway M-ring protein FliF/YscJ
MGGSGNLPIGPGVWGFIALFVLAIALWFLVRNMNARLRRMAYREHERIEAEQAQKAQRDDAGGAETPDKP